MLLYILYLYIHVVNNKLQRLHKKLPQCAQGEAACHHLFYALLISRIPCFCKRRRLGGQKFGA